jgi:hypothetical protein
MDGSRVCLSNSTLLPRGEQRHHVAVALLLLGAVAARAALRGAGVAVSGGDRPLSFVFGVEFDLLVGYEIDIALPAQGSLLIFRPELEFAGDPDPETRLIYVPPGNAVTHRAAPSGRWIQ